MFWEDEEDDFRSWKRTRLVQRINLFFKATDTFKHLLKIGNIAINHFTHIRVITLKVSQTFLTMASLKRVLDAVPRNSSSSSFRLLFAILYMIGTANLVNALENPSASKDGFLEKCPFFSISQQSTYLFNNIISQLLRRERF